MEGPYFDPWRLNTSELSPISPILAIRQGSRDSAPLVNIRCRAIPEPIPAPGLSATIATGGSHPFEPSIVDFHFQHILDDGPVVGRFPLDDVINKQGPKALMRGEKPKKYGLAEPNLRWIHLPFNSMQYAERLIKKVCEDLEIDRDQQLASEVILADDKWRDRLHRRRKTDGHHATYMHTTCSEISIGQKFLQDGNLNRFNHRGANMVLFMPFLHWGTETVLDWRDEAISLIDAGSSPPPNPSESEMRRFYHKMMTDQLTSSEKPLHLRRTLDQFYYDHVANTRGRDTDQIVSKYGPDKENKGNRVILLVDQLWLWILGNTLVTCFDRRWDEDNNPRSNIFDNVLWKLQQGGQAIRIQTPYDMANLVIDEASGYFFTYSHSLEESLHFREIFRQAISDVSDKQIKLFADLADLNRKGPAMNLTRKQQNALFDVTAEFNLVVEARDILDELNIIYHIYTEQLSILNTLFSMQYHDALFRQRHPDVYGEMLPPTAEEHPEGGINHNLSPSDDWDKEEWFKRTEEYMGKHRAAIMDMVQQTDRVHTALQNTISLKQNAANLFEAHANRRATEAVIVFTIVSSIMLPLSFFSSVFGMNVVEISDGSKVPLGIAMAYIVPFSLFLSAFFVSIAFYKDILRLVKGGDSAARQGKGGGAKQTSQQEHRPKEVKGLTNYKHSQDPNVRQRPPKGDQNV